MCYFTKSFIIMKKVSILYFPNYKKKSKKTNLTPIYIRIGGNIVSKKTEANIDIYLNDKELSLWNPIVMRVDAGDCHAQGIYDISNFIEMEDVNLSNKKE